MKTVVQYKKSERGGAGVKFLGVMVVLILMFNAGLNFIPVAYNAENFKQEMQTAVVQGVAIPGRKTPVEMVRQRLQTAALSNGVPEDALVEVKQLNNTVQAHVYYSKDVQIMPFGLYDYKFEFDHTATPSGFLTKQ